MDAAPSEAATPPEAAVDVPYDAPDVGDPLRFDVRARGPFHVGFRQVMTTYTPPGGMPRTIPVSLWYPTWTTTGAHPRYNGIIIDSDSVVNAPPAPSPYGPRYPVHVYSHGYRGWGATSAFLMRYFATHGWVAIAPDHIGNLLGDTPDPLPTNVHYLRPLDITASLDAMERLPATDPFAGRLDTSRVLMSGHSFGTEAVWASSGATWDPDAISAACMPMSLCTAADLAVFRAGTRDPRVVAGIPMAGAINRQFFTATGHTSVRIPLFAMSGTDDPVGADVQWMSTAPMPLTWIEVRGGCHQFFALGGCANIGDDLMEPIVGVYALSLGRSVVLRDTSTAVADILAGRTVLSDTVTFHTR